MNYYRILTAKWYDEPSFKETYGSKMTEFGVRYVWACGSIYIESEQPAMAVADFLLKRVYPKITISYDSQEREYQFTIYDGYIE